MRAYVQKEQFNLLNELLLQLIGYFVRENVMHIHQRHESIVNRYHR